MSSKPKQAPPQKQGQNKGKQQQQQQQSMRGNTVTSDPQMMAAERDRQAARMQRQAQARAAAEKQRRASNLRKLGIVGALVLVVAALIAIPIVTNASKPGQYVQQQASRPHVKPGEAHPAYTTDPPTSGPHVGQVPDFKIYSQPITQELQVHGLEDGGVVINYKPDLDKNVVARINSLATTYLEKPDPNDPNDPRVRHPNRVLVAPYKFQDPNDVIVLTAWERMQRFPSYDEAGMRRFIDEYIGVDSHAESLRSGCLPGKDCQQP